MSDPRYQFQNLIATGGMGEVWRATDTMLGREVAIKLLKPEYADDPVNRSRFDSEARHAAALHHPHVAAVYDVGEMPTASGLMRPFLVMELVDGKPLSDLVKDGRPLDPDVVRDLLGQAGDALAAAHRAGIVHRDVKPANMLVTPDGNVKVTDFGIARAGGSTAITGTGQVMGTPQYLSPEQARGERATPASDVYSLGVVAFECLTGQRPFQKETPVATAIAHLHDPVPPLPATVPPELAAVVTRALSKDAAHRYPDAAAFTQALRDATSGAGMPPVTAPTEVQPMNAGPATMVGGATAVMAADGEPPQGTEPPYDEDPEKGRKSRKVLIILAILALLAVIALVWFFLSREPGDGPTDDPSDTPSATRSPSPDKSPSKKQTTETTPSETATSEDPETFDLNEADYLGRNVNDVVAELRSLGLKTSTAPMTNDGSHDEDSVGDVTPVSGLTAGELVKVGYYEAPPEEPTPTKEPTEEPTDDESTPTDGESSSAEESPSIDLTNRQESGEGQRS